MILKCGWDFSISYVSVRERLFCSFQLELYPSKNWDIWKAFSDAKNNSQIWALQNRL